MTTRFAVDSPPPVKKPIQGDTELTRFVDELIDAALANRGKWIRGEGPATRGNQRNILAARLRERMTEHTVNRGVVHLRIRTEQELADDTDS